MKQAENQPERKKKDRALLLLLLLLLAIAVSCVYYYHFPAHPNRAALGVQPANHQRDRVAQPKPIDTSIVATDSGSISSLTTADTSGATHTDSLNASNTDKKTVGTDTKRSLNSDDDDDEVGDLTPEELGKLIGKKKEIFSVSTDDDVLALYDPQRKTLNVRPVNSEWGTMYLIYPNPDYRAVLRRNLMYPDFEGMVYPAYRKGPVVYGGSRIDAVTVKIKAPANRDNSYIIQAKTDPKFFIFGDMENKNKWYIYENGKVRKFTPPVDFDALITEKL